MFGYPAEAPFSLHTALVSAATAEGEWKTGAAWVAELDLDPAVAAKNGKGVE